jgi:hypothetical protein
MSILHAAQTVDLRQQAAFSAVQSSIAASAAVTSPATSNSLGTDSAAVVKEATYCSAAYLSFAILSWACFSPLKKYTKAVDWLLGAGEDVQENAGTSGALQALTPGADSLAGDGAAAAATMPHMSANETAAMQDSGK